MYVSQWVTVALEKMEGPTTCLTLLGIELLAPLGQACLSMGGYEPLAHIKGMSEAGDT